MPPEDASAGATPVAPDATSGQSDPAQPAASEPTAPPATGETDGLGDAGKQAIDRMKAERNAAADRAKAAEAELAQLREASQSDQEKALSKARREAAVEERAKWTDHIRHAEVRSALRSAGLTNEKALELVSRAPEFAKLKVSDEGIVEQVAETVEQFKTDYPEMFATSALPSGGAWGGADGGSRGKQPGTLEEALDQHYAAQPRR